MPFSHHALAPPPMEATRQLRGTEVVAANTALKNQGHVESPRPTSVIRPLDAFIHIISGHFCGVLQEQRFEDKPNHPGDYCGIRQVKDIPLERPGRCRDMK